MVALEYGVYLMLFRYQGVAFLSARGIVHMVSELVGGVLIAGVMSWYLYRAIAATGGIGPLRVRACAVRRVTSGCLL